MLFEGFGAARAIGRRSGLAKPKFTGHGLARTVNGGHNDRDGLPFLVGLSCLADCILSRRRFCTAGSSYVRKRLREGRSFLHGAVGDCRCMDLT